MDDNDQPQLPQPPPTPQVNTHPVSSLDRKLIPAFHPTSLLMLRNYRSSAGMSSDTFQKTDPMNAYYHDLASGRVTGEAS